MIKFGDEIYEISKMFAFFYDYPRIFFERIFDFPFSGKEFFLSFKIHLTSEFDTSNHVYR